MNIFFFQRDGASEFKRVEVLEGIEIASNFKRISKETLIWINTLSLQCKLFVAYRIRK